MMSADKFIDTRAKAAVETWGTQVESTSHLRIFANSSKKLTNVTITRLKGVSDDAYPPQKKSFTMLKYLADNYIDKFEWFLRVDDDAYVNFPALEYVLRRSDPNKEIYMGCPGFGHDADDYVPKGMTYCMGGTGVVISRGALKKVKNHLKNCIKTLKTEHEDIEIGRCFHEQGIHCTKAYQAQLVYFYQNYGKNGQRKNNLNNIPYHKYVKALILHPNKSPHSQYLFHTKILDMQKNKLILKIKNLQKDYLAFDRMLMEFSDVDQFSFCKEHVCNFLNTSDLRLKIKLK